MVLKKRLNNNAVIAKDCGGREVILVGRGLGFQAEKGARIDEGKVEKTFVMTDSGLHEQWGELLKDIPIEHVELADEIVGYARVHVDSEISESVIISLCDHMYMAVERIMKEFGVGLEEDEAGFIPVYINNIMTMGYDNVMMPFFACTFATSAAVLAIFIKTKDRGLKEMALPNFISGIFGVTEPAIYGITLPLKTPFIISCVAGGIGGAFYGHFNFRKFMMGGMGIFEFPAMVAPDGSMGNLVVAVVGALISMAAAFVMTMALYKEKGTNGMSPALEGMAGREASASPALEGGAGQAEGAVLARAAGKRTAEAPANRDGGQKDDADSLVGDARMADLVVASPIKGRILELKDVTDSAFSSGVLGKGAAILPDEGVVYSPVDGTVVSIFPTLHVLGIQSDDRLEVLIHIGLDTVQLEGKGFRSFVKDGDRVKVGQKLLEFDMEAIKAAGFSLETPVLVSNYGSFQDVLPEAIGHVEAGERLLHAIRKEGR